MCEYFVNFCLIGYIIFSEMEKNIKKEAYYEKILFTISPSLHFYVFLAGCGDDEMPEEGEEIEEIKEEDEIGDGEIDDE
jgi:hypothetical protein